MFCRKCGTKLADGLAFCGHCGFPVSGAPLPTKEGTNVGILILLSIVGVFAVVITLGILAAIAIPKFTNTVEKAYVASMKSDLRNLATAEEAYYASHQSYTKSLAAMNFTPSASTTVVVTSVHGGEGWAAVARSPDTAISCRVGFGADSITDVGDGVIQCNDLRKGAPSVR
jgi:type IV pilus assembly protein PilA